MLLIVTLVLIINCQTVIANSPPLHISGGVAFPINNDNIKLESEVINIHFDSKTKGYSEYHSVEVIFNFYNMGCETEIDIGFPNIANYGKTLEDFKAYSYPSMVEYEVSLSKMSQEKLEKNLFPEDYYVMDPMDIYAWKMPFDKGERKSVKVTYGYGDQMLKQADYVLMTGSLWKDNIDKIDIYVDFPDKLSFQEIYATPRNYYYNGSGIEWHFQNVEPDSNLYIERLFINEYDCEFLDFTPRQLSEPAEGDKYFWKDYYGTLNLRLDLEDYRSGVPFSFYLSPENFVDPFKESYFTEELKSLYTSAYFSYTEILARNGYTFSEKEQEQWRKYYQTKAWYKPIAGFNSTDRISSYISGIEYRNYVRLSDFIYMTEHCENAQEIISLLCEYDDNVTNGLEMAGIWGYKYTDILKKYKGLINYPKGIEINYFNSYNDSITNEAKKTAEDFYQAEIEELKLKNNKLANFNMIYKIALFGLVVVCLLQLRLSFKSRN